MEPCVTKGLADTLPITKIRKQLKIRMEVLGHMVKDVGKMRIEFTGS